MIAGAYTPFEYATFAHERGARSLESYFLEILPPPGGFLFVHYARSHFIVELLHYSHI